MKIVVIFIISMILSSCVQESLENYPVETVIDNRGISKGVSNNLYYWYDGVKVYFNRISDKHFVILDNSKSDITSLDSFVMPFTKGTLYPYSLDITKTNGQVSESYVYGIIDEYTRESYRDEIIYESPLVITDAGHEIGISPLFSVKLKSVNDISLLNTFVEENNLLVIEHDYIPLWHILSCTQYSTGSALDMSNKAYESGLFEATSVDFINAYTCSEDVVYSDPEFCNQWNLTSIYGLDVEAVHSITKGNPSIKVAIIDTGFQINHPDLAIDVSWDATTMTSPARQYTYDKPSWGAHGTRMAGIIGAQINNRGVVGIAPDVTLIPISVQFGVTNNPNLKIGTAFDLAKAVYYAANTADVINNSWNSSVYNQDLDEATKMALTAGRNGRGCVFVQCSGNDTLNVSTFPYIANSEVICVGNTNVAGRRYYNSVYGSHLDVVAPGTNILTTDILSSYSTSTGTSPACAHVSAVAGLMLSVNPYLSLSELTNIIERTARKLPYYSFSIRYGRPNGTWNDEVGYGLIDAHAAVGLAYRYNEDNYANLIEFDYSGSSIEMSLTIEDDIAIIWDWDAKDISFISASEASPVDTAIIHTFNTAKNRRIIVAETVDPDESSPSWSSALTSFELTTGVNATNIDIKQINSALEYIKIIGGAGMALQTMTIHDLPALKDLYLVNIPNANVSIYDCSSLLRFGSSKYIWGAPTIGGGISTGQLPENIGGTVSPDVVGGSSSSVWPAVPETIPSFASLYIANCNNLQEVSLENVSVNTVDFSSCPRLRYLYITSQADKIVGGSTSPSNTSTKGEYLYTTISTLPHVSSNDRGRIYIKGVNTSNTTYGVVGISTYYMNLIANYAANTNWEVVYGSNL